MRIARAFMSASFALAACAARTGLYEPEEAGAVDATIDVTHHDASPPLDASIDVIDVIDAAPSPFCASNDASIPNLLCSVNVHVGHVQTSMATCFVDTVVHEGDDGVVSFACNGDKSTWANAQFPDGGFLGSVNGTTVDLCTGTVFPWSDGCTWASAQRITGDVDSGTLMFTYDEAPIQGSPCEPPCSAQAPIFVQ